MRLATLFALLALAAAALAGCGSSSSSNEGAGQGSGGAAGSAESTGAESGAGAGAPSAPAGARAARCRPGEASLRAAGVSCTVARRVLAAWQAEASCSRPSGASRTSCRARSYRCLGARTDRGLAVSCARRGRSVSFVAKLP